MMKRLFFTAMIAFVLVVSTAKAQDTINVHEVYAEAEFCLDSITFFVTPEQGMDGTFPPHWITYDMEWNALDTIEGLFYTVRETPTRFVYYRGDWMIAIWCDVTLHKTPEELKVSFEREVPLEPCGTEIFAYDLINGEENPKLSCLWDDGETAFSRIVYDGAYTVTVSDSCGRQVTNTWLVGDYTNVNETVASSPSVYPNPAHGAFTVRGEGNLVIFNSIGQKVHELEIDNETTIDGLPAGMYFVRNDETTTKVVVR